jgi:hypothetical protein
VVIIQRDPYQNQAVWFWKYFPTALQTKLQIQPKVSDITTMLQNAGFKDVEAIPIDDPMAKRFYDPTAPLDPQFRDSFSEFSYLTPEDIGEGVMKLNAAIQDGSVEIEINNCKERFRELGGTVFLIFGNKVQ